jgi:molybdate transport system substrate-binding protein
MRALRAAAVAAALLLLLAVVSCSPKAPAPTAASGRAGAAPDQISGSMLVFVPCGMAGPFGEVKKLFQERHPGIKMDLKVENVDVQAKLVEDGKAQPDAWLSLGDVEIARAQKAGLVDGEPSVFAYNSLAFLVGKGNPCQIESLEDLQKPGVKTIAVPSERNSSGAYVKQALEAKGLWEPLKPKLWLTDHPSEVKTQLVAGKADVGLVYYPCMKEAQKTAQEPDPARDKVEMLGRLDDEKAARIPILAAVAKGAKQPALGRALVEFLLTPEAQDIWGKWDFGRAIEKESDKLVKTTLTMYCGAGLRPFMDPAIEAFRAAHPDIKIEVQYAGSGCLLSQLTFAKRGDLYMPGEEFYLDQAREKDYIADAGLVGYLEPVLLVAKGNPKGVKGLEDMARKDLRVGIGNTEVVAAGKAAKETLEKAGLWAQVQPNIAVEVGNVPELANNVQIGSLDLALVWNITAKPVEDKCDTVSIPKEYWKPIAAPLGLLKFSKSPEAAKAFLEFCLSKEGQDLVAESGMMRAADVAPAGEGKPESGV